MRGRWNGKFAGRLGVQSMRVHLKDCRVIDMLYNRVKLKTVPHYVEHTVVGENETSDTK